MYNSAAALLFDRNYRIKIIVANKLFITTFTIFKRIESKIHS